MAERLRGDQPHRRPSRRSRASTRPSASDELARRAGSTHVVDAIDNLTAKAHLVATCLARGIPLVSSMGAAARLDPTRIRVADLTETQRDPFARALRKMLRREHALTVEQGMPLGVPAVYSDEEPRDPAPVSYDEGKGFVCVCPNKDNGMHTCERRSRIDGSASFVTGAFGLAAASVVVRAAQRGPRVSRCCERPGPAQDGPHVQGTR